MRRFRLGKIEGTPQTTTWAVVTLSLELRYTSWNSVAEDWSGISAEEILGSPLGSLGWSENPIDLVPMVQAAINSGLPCSFLIPGITPNSGRIIEWSVLPLPEQVVLVGRDVTDFLAAAEQLRVQNALWTSAFTVIDNPLAVFDGEGRMLEANAAYRRAFLTNPIPEEPSRCFGFGVPVEPGVRLETVSPVLATIRDGKPRKIAQTRTRNDGAFRLLEVSTTPIFDSNGMIEKIVEVSNDVTEHDMIERQMRHAQKMEAIGTLAGGIAHDFNNILFGILGYTELVRMDLPPDSLSARNLEQVIRSAQRARDLVQRLQMFSRHTDLMMAPLDLAPLLSEVIQVIKPSVPPDVELRVRLLDASPRVLADSGQISQVLINLCNNALEAMAGRPGLVEVRLESIFVEDDLPAPAVVPKPGHYAVITVSDTGKGIPQDHLERIFEPFFTTKGVGGGPGLGLAVTHGIVSNHGGTITVYSEPGVGTSFRVYLPRIEGEPSAADSHMETVCGGSERILLVDDDRSIVEMCRQTLTRLGYQVVARTDSREALALVQGNPEDYDVVVTDQTMPGFSGVELARELHKLPNQLPVLLITGFGLSLSEEQARALGIRAMLTKPVLSRDLALALRKILDQLPDKAP